MAIDSAEKRRSIVGLSYHYYSPGVTPNASPDAEWRQQSAHSYSGFAAEAPVTVPDVVGQTQANAITAIEAEGLVASVETAYSDSVSVGVVIEQDPAASSSVPAGSTVTITVSLGPQPEEDEQPTGGWLFLNLYEAEQQRRRKREEEIEEVLEQIEDSVDREIAAILQTEMARDEELDRLKSLAEREADLKAAEAYSERVSKAYQRAIKQGNRSALEALDREMKRAQDEEQFLMLAIAMVLDD